MSSKEPTQEAHHRSLGSRTGTRPRPLAYAEESTALLGTTERCINIGDRESHIYELFCAAREIGTHFVLRTRVDRLAGDGARTIEDEMQESRLQRAASHRSAGQERQYP